MKNISIVVGNPKPNSRTGRIARMLVDQLFSGSGAAVELIDLADHADLLFKWPCPPMAELNERVARSDLVVFATPTYKASYTGLLKAFLDRYPAGGLKGVVALPVMTGADFGHSLAPNVHLIPLLLELGATLPGAGLYFNTQQMDQIDTIVAAKAADLRASFAALGAIASAISGPSPEDKAS